jgi:hypothetical protein
MKITWICEKCLEELKKTNPEYIQAKEWRKKNERLYS